MAGVGAEEEGMYLDEDFVSQSMVDVLALRCLEDVKAACACRSRAVSAVRRKCRRGSPGGSQ